MGSLSSHCPYFPSDIVDTFIVVAHTIPSTFYSPFPLIYIPPLFLRHQAYSPHPDPPDEKEKLALDRKMKSAAKIARLGMTGGGGGPNQPVRPSASSDEATLPATIHSQEVLGPLILI